ncbi:MAG: hypothetical protein GY748_08410 [Planctomycetaceae bacterium]|nr:hypothetical protein [Planctomycetaceae bacterium]
MSLRVRCPEGCIVHASMTRCGKVVKCPECGTMIRIPEISDAQRKGGRTVECRAERYKQIDGHGASPVASLPKELPKKDLPRKATNQSRLPVAKPRQHSSIVQHQAFPAVEVEIEGEQVGIDSPSSPQAFVSGGGGDKTRSKRIGTAGVKEPIVRGNLNVSLGGSTKEKSFNSNEGENWEERLTRANADRFFLAKLFAVGLVFVAGLNLIPVLTQLITWGDLFQVNEIPNWFFLQVSICLLNLLYAIFLFQINDWSAMRSVSVLMLVLAFIYGICCTGLLLGGNEGSVVTLLEISSVRIKQATSGFAVMLCLATLMSYWAAREASNWQRAEQVLKQILLKRTH